MGRYLDQAFPARPLLWGFGAAAAGASLALVPRSGPLILALAALTAAGLVFARRDGPPARRWAAVAFLAALAACFGLLARRATVPGPDDVASLCGRHAAIVGVVSSEAEPLGQPPDRRWRFLVTAEAARTSEGTRTVSGLLAVVADERPRHGERLLLGGVPRRPRGRSNPGGFNAAAYWRGRGVFATLTVDRPSWYSLGPARSGGVSEWARRLRHRVLAANQRALPPRAAYLVNSLVLGEAVPPEGVDAQAVERTFRATGTVHVLVVSGTQVGLILLPVLWLCRRSLRLRRLGFLLAVPVCTTYALLVGGDSSVMRAAWMGGGVALALSLWRDGDVLNLLGAAGLCLLAVNPMVIQDLGFLLSFAAVWGLVALSPLFFEALRRPAPLIGEEATVPLRFGREGMAWLLRRNAGLIAACLGAYLATAPLLAHYLQADARLAATANLVVVPISALLLYAGWLHSLWALIGTPAGWLSAAVTHLADGLWSCVSWFAAQPVAHGSIFPLPASLAAVVLILFALSAGRGTRRLRPAFACLGAGWALLIAGESWPAAAPRHAEVTFLDVGQGDSVLVRLPDGRTMLVDGGGSPRAEYDVGERVVLPALRALRLPRLDLVVATHPHEDHVGGLPAVVREVPVGLFLDSGQNATSPLQRQLLLTLKERQVPFRVVQAGERFRFGVAAIEVLAPFKPPLSGTRSDLNNNSVVLRLELGGRRLLLPGDAETAAEERLLASGVDLRADVLKLGHHGSAHSSSPAWLAAVRPRVAVASCGVENRFGHPAPETVERLRGVGAVLCRTDRDGAVTCTLCPDGLRVHCELSR